MPADRRRLLTVAVAAAAAAIALFPRRLRRSRDQPDGQRCRPLPRSA